MKTIKLFCVLGLLTGLSFTPAMASIDLTSYGSQPGNSGDATIAAWVSLLVGNYNAANNPDLPTPGTAFAFKVPDQSPAAGYPTIGNNQLSITIPTGGYDYVALHWGNGQTAFPYQLFYIGDAASLNAGSVTFENEQNGLSWYSVWTPTPSTQTAVPEASTWLAGGLLLLPLSIGMLRSRFQRRAADRD